MTAPLSQQGAFRLDAIGTVYGVILGDARELAAREPMLRGPPYNAPPAAPVIYIKTANTYAASGATLTLPRGAHEVQVCGALGVGFSAAIARASEAHAMDAVAGYVAAIDFTLPHASLHRPPIREKCFDGSCVFSDRWAPRAGIADPSALELTTYVNGKAAERRDLRRLVRPLPKLIADLTAFMTFSAGDILLAGVLLDALRAMPGDEVALEIAGVGRAEARIAEARS